MPGSSQRPLACSSSTTTRVDTLKDQLGRCWVFKIFTGNMKVAKVWLSVVVLLKKLKWKKEVYTDWKKGLTTWEDDKNAVKEQLSKLDIRKSMGPDGIHLFNT
ncbi:hypothetical protein llap_11026 [Limosa lapponica baueri]|uniref:Rna-directed dna polymerase from mobile element jockey-like n=1 Tax=Limosa lapponica baueri TaxID=1758121 RepID=A0A2I0TY24_LIMLA|nr:hypothetical protein llap_11026 [Limosa lapponica baueri]